MMCPGCYRPTEGYCTRCRHQLFDGARVSPVLSFDRPGADNLNRYQEKTKRLSISGVQLKYSLRLEGKELVLTEQNGQYIIKPIPPILLIAAPEQAPENEHLTMQIAAQVFGIRTAANALIYFRDGSPAYITRRFDVKKDGSKFLQEDMAQISGKTKETGGVNFKYEGRYEEIGPLIRRYVAAATPAIESFFRVVVFNYIFSNGDAHLKNFSLMRTDQGEYVFTPAYDLMCSVLHSPLEGDTALELYEGDIDSAFYQAYGFFGQSNFRELGKRLGMLPVRINHVLTQILTSREQVRAMVQSSFLSGEAKQKYIAAYEDKLRRMGMTGEMIAKAINAKYPFVYAPTTAPTTLTLRDGKVLVGYFEQRQDTDRLAEENQYSFIEFRNKDKEVKERFTIVNGDDLVKVEYREGRV